MGAVRCREGAGSHALVGMSLLLNSVDELRRRAPSTMTIPTEQLDEEFLALAEG
jgi:hypothetical protein